MKIQKIQTFLFLQQGKFLSFLLGIGFLFIRFLIHFEETGSFHGPAARTEKISARSLLETLSAPISTLTVSKMASAI